MRNTALAIVVMRVTETYKANDVPIASPPPTMAGEIRIRRSSDHFPSMTMISRNPRTPTIILPVAKKSPMMYLLPVVGSTGVLRRPKVPTSPIPVAERSMDTNPTFWFIVPTPGTSCLTLMMPGSMSMTCSFLLGVILPYQARRPGNGQRKFRTEPPRSVSHDMTTGFSHTKVGSST